MLYARQRHYRSRRRCSRLACRAPHRHLSGQSGAGEVLASSEFPSQLLGLSAGGPHTCSSAAPCCTSDSECDVAGDNPRSEKIDHLRCRPAGPAHTPAPPPPAAPGRHGTPGMRQSPPPPGPARFGGGKVGHALNNSARHAHPNMCPLICVADLDALGAAALRQIRLHRLRNVEFACDVVLHSCQCRAQHPVQSNTHLLDRKEG